MSAYDDRNQVVSRIQEKLREFLFTETEVFYYHLENVGVRRDEILDKPEEFVDALHDIFGNGAALIESAIISEIKASNSDTAAKQGLVDVLKSIERRAK
ncbi:hypothetical protein NTE_01440 [Candidatus Nitrososphaera evergladensis SR1]|uniref:Uncharacterized protein n=1 Tax=Candidatus Nitrososphaera evergladensis SR1 TaxID=1459636 RepID=A0A075MW32_9ARCH|nr:NitrOD5 domain-containing protein [Candidatus Nitrososphaera evergladensis]AIF83504.1 hypothetical protein NTE_01440 [Candidatus Nitrososphaera evergladensis SR1]